MVTDLMAEFRTTRVYCLAGTRFMYEMDMDCISVIPLKGQILLHESPFTSTDYYKYNRNMVYLF